MVALDGNEVATGELFMDDGVSLDPVRNGLYFKVNNKPRALK